MEKNEEFTTITYHQANNRCDPFDLVNNGRGQKVEHNGKRVVTPVNTTEKPSLYLGVVNI